jgi:hypothetical protein
MAGRYNMVCNQGATFQIIFTVKTDGVPWNLVGNYTARMQVRKFSNSTTKLIELTTENGRISFGPDGVTTLNINATDTENLASGRWYYDLEFEDGAGTVTRMLEGRFVVRREITYGH